MKNPARSPNPKSWITPADWRITGGTQTRATTRALSTPTSSRL